MTGAAPPPPGRPGAAALGRLLVASSRPFSWINTALPFAAGALLVDFALTPALLLGLAYFLLPFNLLMYGVNDLFDYASDLANPRKGSIEGARLGPETARALWISVAVTNLPLLAAMFWAGGPAAGTCMLAAAAAALIYSAPPPRTKERPFLDSLTSASHFVLPAVTGLLAAGLAPADLPWVALAGFTAWGMASHALGAIQDIDYDRAAGIGSIATAIGARPTAAFALAGYGAAVACAATLGPAGVAAAVVLASYTLLPIAVLARPDEPQARMAWRSFLGLNLLAGFLLTQILLRHWGLLPFTWAELVARVALTAAVLVLLNLLLSSLALRRSRGGAAVHDPGARSITVVIPCRDEARRLPAALAGVLAQDQPGVRVVVVNDGSTDGTGVLARGLLDAGNGAAPGPHRVIDAPPRPPGWSGKCWAAWQGVAAAAASGGDSTETAPDGARNDLVLFLDADTVLEPQALRELTVALDAGGHDLVSGVTRYAMPTLAERLLMPGFPMLLFGFLPLWLLNRRRGRPAALAFAYGPLILARRRAYLECGGHRAIHGTGHDDIALARAFVRSGFSVGIVHAADLGATRHFTSGRQVAAAWRRVFFPSVGSSIAAGIASIGAFSLAWLLPLAAPLVLDVAAQAGDASAAANLQAAWLAFGIIAGARAFLAIWQREPPETIVWTPVTALATMAFHVGGLAAGILSRPVVWRGRSLRPGVSGSAQENLQT